jgi:imidazolonepropionase-like amidohydrolase
MMDHTRQVHEAGIPVVAGTDGPTKGVFLGEGLHRELELLVEAGLTPLEAISAATRNGAMMMKTEDEWGTIEAGKRADLLVIDGRPDQTISDTRNIVTVIQAGRLIDRNDLKSRVIDSKDVHDFVPTEN